MTARISLRYAEPRDAEKLLEIYRPYIEETVVTFENDVPTEAEFARRIVEKLQQFPWIVAEVDGEIAGYCYAGRHRGRAAYRWCVESSIFVDQKFHRLGLARNLYNKLFYILAQQGIIHVYAGIALPNEASVAFHESLGFSHFATYENVGFKLDKWITVGWWEKRLGNLDQKPTELVSFVDFSKEKRDRFLGPI